MAPPEQLHADAGRENQPQAVRPWELQGDRAGHGPKDLSKKHVGMILRLLESVGFDRAKVRREWGDT